MNKIIIVYVFILCIALGKFIFADTIIVNENAYLHGEIERISTTQMGLLIKMKDLKGNTIVPSNAPDTPYGWLVIPRKRKTIVTIAMLCWVQKVPLTVYCGGTIGGCSWAEVVKIDPVN